YMRIIGCPVLVYRREDVYNQPIMSLTGNKMIVDGVWVLTGRVVSMLSGLLVIVFITRLLDSAEVGFYFLCFSLITILALVSQLGMNLAVVRLIAEALSNEKHEQAASVATLAVKVVAKAIVVVSCLGLFFVVIKPPEVFVSLSLDRYVLLILMVWFSFQTMLGIISESLRGYHDVRAATLYGATLPGLLSVVAMYLLWSLVETSSIDLVLSLLAGPIVLSTVLGAGRLWKIILPSRGQGQADLSGIVSVAWPMWSTNITLLLLTQADIWIIGSFLTVDDVAVYGAAARLIMAIPTSLMILNAVVSPVIADQFYRQQQTRLEQTLRTGTTLAAIPSALVMVVFCLAGESLLVLLYGPFYSDGYLILVVLGIGQLFNVISGPCGMVLLMTGHQRSMMVISVLTSLLAIVASIYAVIHVGVLGVAAVFSAALIVQNILMMHFAGKYTGIKTFMNFRIAIPAA
ncbi:MAG: oligosaccharide flippase family protein, partial [Gammaproteobacteria bacterium]